MSTEDSSTTAIDVKNVAEKSPTPEKEIKNPTEDQNGTVKREK